MKTCMLLFHDLIYPRVDPRVYKEAASLLNFNIHVTVISWSVDFSGEGKTIDFLSKHDEFEGIKIRRIFQTLSSYNKPIYFRIYQQLSAMLKMADEATLEKPDLVHSHDLTTLLTGVIVKCKLKIPLIYDSHEYWPGMVRERNGFLIGKISEVFEKLLLTQVDSVITVSEMLADSFERSVTDTNVLYNSRKKHEMQDIDEVEIEKIKSKLDISKDDFVVGYIGAINSKRGIDNLIEAFDYLKNSNVKLLIVGGGPTAYIEELKSKIKHEKYNRIIFTGEVPYHEVVPYFSILNVGCVLFQPMPNHSIAAPNKLFEYMSMGIPLLVSMLPEMDRIVRIDSKCGISVDPRDSQKIAESIDWLYENRVETEKMGKNGLKAFNDKYCWDNMEKILVKTYEELL